MTSLFGKDQLTNEARNGRKNILRQSRTSRRGDFGDIGDGGGIEPSFSYMRDETSKDLN